MRWNHLGQHIALIESKRLHYDGIEQLYPDDDRQTAIASDRMLL